MKTTEDEPTSRCLLRPRPQPRVGALAPSALTGDGRWRRTPSFLPPLRGGTLALTGAGGGDECHRSCPRCVLAPSLSQGRAVATNAIVLAPAACGRTGLPPPGPVGGGGRWLPRYAHRQSPSCTAWPLSPAPPPPAVPRARVRAWAPHFTRRGPHCARGPSLSSPPLLRHDRTPLQHTAAPFHLTWSSRAPPHLRELRRVKLVPVALLLKIFDSLEVAPLLVDQVLVVRLEALKAHSLALEGRLLPPQ